MQHRKQQRNHWISKVIVASAAAFGLAVAAPGCAVRGRSALYVSDRTPPAPRYIDAPYRPGYVYIQGHWENYDSGWTWREGRWDRHPGRRPRHVNDYYPR